MVYNAIMTAPDLMAAAVPTADGGSHLDRFADIFGILRSPGTRAGVTVTFTGTDNTIIPEGDMGCNRQRRTIPHIDRCRLPAAQPVQKRKRSRLAVHITWTPVQSTVAEYHCRSYCRYQSGCGREAAAMQKAIARSMSASIHCSASLLPAAISTIINSGQESAAVWAMWRCCLWNGNGTVKVILAGEDKLPVGEPICTAVAAHIEEERPIGANVTVVSVAALTMTVAANVTLDEDDG